MLLISIHYKWLKYDLYHKSGWISVEISNSVFLFKKINLIPHKSTLIWTVFNFNSTITPLGRLKYIKFLIFRMTLLFHESNDTVEEHLKNASFRINEHKDKVSNFAIAENFTAEALIEYCQNYFENEMLRERWEETVIYQIEI